MLVKALYQAKIEAVGPDFKNFFVSATNERGPSAYKNQKSRNTLSKFSEYNKNLNTQYDLAKLCKIQFSQWHFFTKLTLESFWIKQIFQYFVLTKLSKTVFYFPTPHCTNGGGKS